MKLRHTITAIPLLLAACGGVQMQPANPAVTARIVAACTADGAFKAVGGRLVLQALPYAGQVDQILAMGIDGICANPEAFAVEIATDMARVEWIAKNLAAVVRRPS